MIYAQFKCRLSLIGYMVNQDEAKFFALICTVKHVIMVSVKQI